MPIQRSLQLLDQSRFHVVIIIRDSQADHRLSIQSITELFPQDSTVLLLHDKDHVSPTNMPLVDPDSCAWFCTGRSYFVTRKPLVHGLSSQASQSVLATNEEELLRLVHTIGFALNNSFTFGRSSAAIVNAGTNIAPANRSPPSKRQT